MAVSAIVDYVCGIKIHEMDNDASRRRFLMFSLVLNLSLMGFFKYAGWVSGGLATVFSGFGIGFTALTVPLPPGVSFYTFQTMSYTIDIYKKQFKPERNFISYLSFVTFFPQLVAGPIERAKDLVPQLATQRKLVTSEVASSALFLLLFGLFQKVVLADNFGNIVDLVFSSLNKDDNSLLPGMGLVFAYAFAFQIYCDFAAYSTIARGVARLFSVHLNRNFRIPYSASSPSKFWERWHISLSQWLRDYVYIPLGGNRHGSISTLRNLVITMLLAGMWHGAGILFIVWGLYHGLLLVFYRIVPIDKYLIRHFGRAGKILSVFIFFHLICIGWIFFRCTPDQLSPIFGSIAAIPNAIVQSFSSVWSYWVTLSGPLHFFGLLRGTLHQFIIQNWAFSFYLWGVLIFGIPLIVTDYFGWIHNVEFGDLFDKLSWAAKCCLILLIIYSIAFFGQRQANEFIYFAF